MDTSKNLHLKQTSVQHLESSKWCRHKIESCVDLEEHYKAVKRSESGEPHLMLQQPLFPASEGMQDCCHLLHSCHPLPDKPLNQP